ncbi:hypothetical protein BDK51DRAFT_43907, partial [Blyttiomyces helicus]
DDDFAGILKVDRGGKKKNQCSIGKFGLGFNVVYYLVDVVIILSGRKIAFLDPLGLLGPSSDSGAVVDFVEDGLFAVYPDIAQSFSVLPGFRPDRSYEGTCILLPLRSKPSDISSTTPSAAEILKLVANWQEEASRTLLFIQNVEAILAYKVGTSRETIPLFSHALVSLSNDAWMELRRKRRYLQECVARDRELDDSEHVQGGFRAIRRGQLWAKMSVSPVSHTTPFETVYGLDVETKVPARETITRQWILAARYQTTSACRKLNLPDLSERKLFAHVGVAALSAVSENGEPKLPMKSNGEIFSFLPLPDLGSGVPFHINGCFDLNSSRTALNYEDNDAAAETGASSIEIMKRDEGFRWNHYLMNDLLPSIVPLVIEEHVQRWVRIATETSLSPDREMAVNSLLWSTDGLNSGKAFQRDVRKSVFEAVQNDPESRPLFVTVKPILSATPARGGLFEPDLKGNESRRFRIFLSKLVACVGTVHVIAVSPSLLVTLRSHGMFENGWKRLAPSSLREILRACDLERVIAEIARSTEATASLEPQVLVVAPQMYSKAKTSREMLVREALLDYLISDKNYAELVGLRLVPLSPEVSCALTALESGGPSLLFARDHECSLFGDAFQNNVRLVNFEALSLAFQAALVSEEWRSARLSLAAFAVEHVRAAVQRIFKAPSSGVGTALSLLVPWNRGTVDKDWIDRFWVWAATENVDVAHFEELPLLPTMTGDLYKLSRTRPLLTHPGPSMGPTNRLLARLRVPRLGSLPKLAPPLIEYIVQCDSVTALQAIENVRGSVPWDSFLQNCSADDRSELLRLQLDCENHSHALKFINEIPCWPLWRYSKSPALQYGTLRESNLLAPGVPFLDLDPDVGSFINVPVHVHAICCKEFEKQVVTAVKYLTDYIGPVMKRKDYQIPPGEFNRYRSFIYAIVHEIPHAHVYAVAATNLFPTEERGRLAAPRDLYVRSTRPFGTVFKEPGVFIDAPRKVIEKLSHAKLKSVLTFDLLVECARHMERRFGALPAQDDDASKQLLLADALSFYECVLGSSHLVRWNEDRLRNLTFVPVFQGESLSEIMRRCMPHRPLLASPNELLLSSNLRKQIAWILRPLVASRVPLTEAEIFLFKGSLQVNDVIANLKKLVGYAKEFCGSRLNQAELQELLKAHYGHLSKLVTEGKSEVIRAVKAGIPKELPVFLNDPIHTVELGKAPPFRCASSLIFQDEAIEPFLMVEDDLLEFKPLLVALGAHTVRPFDAEIKVTARSKVPGLPSYLLDDDKFPDVELILADGERIPVHRPVVANISPVFEKMLSLDCVEKRSGTIILPGVTGEVGAMLVRYAYTGDLCIGATPANWRSASEQADDENVLERLLDVVEAANYYSIPHLSELVQVRICRIFTHLNWTPVIEEFADKHRAYKLLDFCRAQREANPEVFAAMRSKKAELEEYHHLDSRRSAGTACLPAYEAISDLVDQPTTSTPYDDFLVDETVKKTGLRTSIASRPNAFFPAFPAIPSPTPRPSIIPPTHTPFDVQGTSSRRVTPPFPYNPLNTLTQAACDRRSDSHSQSARPTRIQLDSSSSP